MNGAKISAMNHNDVLSFKQQFVPPQDLSNFNPADYFNQYEFSDPNLKLENKDEANFLIQMMYHCDFLAMRGMSDARETSMLRGSSSFFQLLRTNFKDLEGWADIEYIIAQQGEIYFTDLIHFFCQFFEPQSSHS